MASAAQAEGAARRVNLHLGYGERAMLIGPNGIGKTTLLRLITGPAQALGGRYPAGPRRAGSATWRRSRRPSTWPRRHSTHPPAAPLDETEARSFLHYFLFAGDEVFANRSGS
jgi:ATP-binding cassette, subfamily F, member 3